MSLSARTPTQDRFEGKEALDHRELDPATPTHQRAKAIRKSLDYLDAKEAGGIPQRMIEKTVSKTRRETYIDGIYQDAHTIHIVRDGRAVKSGGLVTMVLSRI